MKLKSTALQKGFTLIEMLIVVVIIGILAAIIAPRFTSAASKGTKSLALFIFADNVGLLTRTLNQALGTPANVSRDGTLVSTTGDFLDVLVSGRDCVTANYQTPYDNSGAGTITNSVRTTTAADCAGGAAGAYEVQGYAVSSTSPADGTLSVTFASVPDDLVLQLAQDKDGEASLNAAGDTAGRIQYGAANAATGLRDLTVVTSIR